MIKQHEYKLGFIGSKSTTLECMRDFISDGFSVKYLITLRPKQAAENHVAGYHDLAAFARDNNIETYYSIKYSLKDRADIEKIRSFQLDLLITIGWQRLIPSEVLSSLRIGACGMHGSSWGLPRGRGRSPLNWSLIQDKKSFLTSLILYKAGVDDGSIIGSQLFDINEFDNCETLHFKNRLAMNKLLKEHVMDLFENKIRPREQAEELATYYPQRKPEDGAIDWNIGTREIYNFIRAQTRPFDGAFTFLKGRKVIIWKAQPFDIQLDYSEAKVGEVVELFYNRDFVVKTGDNSLLVTDFGADKEIKRGDVFTSVDYKETLREIVKRYPAFVEEGQKEIKETINL